MSRTFDLILEGGQIVDGSGNPAFAASVGILDGRVSILRGDAGRYPALERVDVTGRVVAPGFIDAHSHSDLVLFDDPLLESKVRQGVTTEVVGVDGISYAPFASHEERAALILQNAGIAGIPEQIDEDFLTIGEMLDAYTGRTAVNVATFVGNTPLRVAALGWDDVHADAAALDRMKGLLRDALDEGALGISTGLDYPPGSYASTEELIELASVVGQAGGIYHTHVRYALGDRFLDPFREASRIAESADVPLQITHFSRSGRQQRPEGAQRLLDFVDDERNRGVQITFDTYPYEWGGTRLSRLLPAWVQAGHPSALHARLSRDDLRAQLYSDIAESEAVGAYRISRPFSDLRLGNLTDEHDARFEGRYLSEVVDELGTPLPVTLVDLVMRNPAAAFTRPSPHAMTLWKFVCHPLGMIASDAVFIGRAPSPRAYGCFARVLGDFVREERLLSLPEAVRKMTSMPAQTLGLRHRGMIADGYHADLAVFDPQTVGANATYEKPREFATGVTDVFVAGVAVLRNGRMTGATPGRGLRA